MIRNTIKKNVMKNYFCLLIAVLLISTISCEKDGVTDPYLQGSLAQDMLIDNDLSVLSTRITFKNDQLVYSFTDPIENLKGESAPSLNIQVIGSLESPGYKDEVLQASHIRIADGYAYIAYNTQGPRFLGGIDIIDVNPATDPKLISSVVFINPVTNTGKDVSSIDIEPKSTGSNNVIWMAGAEENNVSLGSPAIVERFALNSANQFEKGMIPRQYYNLKGYVGTDIRFFEDKIYATSGTGGGLTVLDNQMNELNFYSIENARSVDVNKNYTVSLGGNPGHLYSPDLWDAVIGGASDPEAKSMVRLCYETNGTIVTKGTKCTGNFALTALGEDGLKCFNLSYSHSVPVSSLPRPVIPDDGNAWEYVTNGVSVSNGGWVYIANGAGGLDIAKLDNYGNADLAGQY